MNAEGSVFDLGIEHLGTSPFQPDYLLADGDLRPGFTDSPLVMYLPSQRIRLKPGGGASSLGDVYDPYFNRTYEHFCSHQHAPAQPEPSGYVCGAKKGNLLYLAHPVFSIYHALGAVAYRRYIAGAIRQALGDPPMVESNLPSTARLSVTEQPEAARRVVHLLYASTIRRGNVVTLSDDGYVRPGTGVEVIEELLPLHDIRLSLRMDKPPSSVTLEPQSREIPFRTVGDRVEIELDSFTCHQMVVLNSP